MAGRGGRTCTVCRHSELARIEEGLLRGVPLRALQADFRVSPQALIRHRDAAEGHLHAAAPAPATALVRGDSSPVAGTTGQGSPALNAARELLELVRLGKEYLAAADEQLRGPDGRLWLGPTPHDIFVQIVHRQDDGKRTVRREHLSDLLARIEKGLGIETVGTRQRFADPRKLFLSTMGRMQALLESTERRIEDLDRREVRQLKDVLASPEWQGFLGILFGAIEAHPEAKRDVFAALEKGLREVRSGADG